MVPYAVSKVLLDGQDADDFVNTAPNALVYRATTYLLPQVYLVLALNIHQAFTS